MPLTRLGAARSVLIRDPRDIHGCEDLIRKTDDDRDVYRWFCRLMLLTGSDVVNIEGSVLRKAILATRSVDDTALRRSLRGIDAFHHERVRPLMFFAAAILVTERVDLAEARQRRIAFDACRDNLEKAVSLLSQDVVPSSPGQAYSICILKHYLIVLMRTAGFTEHLERMALDVALFTRAMRARFGEDATRSFAWRWTFAIGHMVISTFMVKGQDAGLLDFRRARFWDGRMANAALRDRLLALSSEVAPVPMGTMFAETFGAYQKEWVDGRPVDLFTACGLIADRAGDARGGILAPPAAGDPDLARFRAATGLRAEDRIVTLHCREAGFRVDRHQDVRNADITSYLPAIRALTARGFTVVRLGDRSMTRLPDMDGVIDYAHSPLKTKALDILLPGAAAFHVGSSSGLSQVPLLYGTPCLFTNWYPCDLLPWGRANWTILKPLVVLGNGARVDDWATYRGLGLQHSRRVLNDMGYDIAELSAPEIGRVVADFADSVEQGPTPRAKDGANVSRVLLPVATDRAIDVTA